MLGCSARRPPSTGSTAIYREINTFPRTRRKKDSVSIIQYPDHPGVVASPRGEAGLQQREVPGLTQVGRGVSARHDTPTNTHTGYCCFGPRRGLVWKKALGIHRLRDPLLVCSGHPKNPQSSRWPPQPASGAAGPARGLKLGWVLNFGHLN